ncbi:MAG TPA: sorbosone dehydrogenase family protein [Candidatus Acidoferrales bacterium]|nr:sorbosone dehydrogenase family protein [Candidatus Acidoferrales bacterium]
MKRVHQGLAIAFCLLLLLFVASRAEYAAPRGASPANAEAAADTSPFTDFHGEAPGNVHKITPADLPAPYATKSAAVFTPPIPKPADAWPKAPDGFKVERYAENLKAPRLIQTAPNGDLFVAATNAGEILVFRGITSDGKPEKTEVFATGFTLPFGIAFYPPGPNPKYVYVGNTDSIVRFPYQNGDLKARGPQEVIVPNLPPGNVPGTPPKPGAGGHFTRNVAFSRDGKQMFIAVGSRANVSDVDADKTEFHRANILVANPDGSNLRVYASGIRNPVGLTVNPENGEVWTSVNERDELGDNLPPDYITHVQEGGFYGWPWYYTGGNPDPRFPGKHPELKDKVIVPDVLMEPHNASLQLTFYGGKQFPKQYQGQIFAAEHGSWNRSVRTGYEVVFVPLKDGHATGEYQDFLTGFVTEKGEVWGRPVGVAVAPDGSLMVTDDGSNSIWRISYAKK